MTTTEHATVTAPVVVIKDQGGKLHYRYQGATIPAGFAAAGELERLQARGMVSRPGGADETADETTAGTAGGAGGDTDQVPSGGVRDVLTWVGEDHTRARRALEHEEARPTQRKGVVDPLRQLLGLPPDGGTPTPAIPAGTNTGTGDGGDQDPDDEEPAGG